MFKLVFTVLSNLVCWVLTTAMSAFFVVGVGILTSRETPISFEPELIGLKRDYRVLLDTGMGSSAELEYSLEELLARLEFGRLHGGFTVHLRNFDQVIDKLLDTDDFRSGDTEYHYGDLVHAYADPAEPSTLRTRVSLRVRTYASVLGFDVGSNSHTHHFNIAVSVQPIGNELHFTFDLGPKDGFPNWAEDDIQRMLTNHQPTVRFTNDLREIGVRFERVEFRGSTEENNLRVIFEGSVPYASILELPEQLDGEEEILELKPPVRNYGEYCSRITRDGLCAHAF